MNKLSINILAFIVANAFAPVSYAQSTAIDYTVDPYTGQPKTGHAAPNPNTNPSRYPNQPPQPPVPTTQTRLPELLVIPSSEAKPRLEYQHVREEAVNGKDGFGIAIRNEPTKSERSKWLKQQTSMIAHAYNIADYDKASKLNQELISALKQDHLQNSAVMLMALNNLVQLQIELGQYKDAHKNLEPLLKNDTKVLGENHPFIIKVLITAGSLYRAQGNQFKALEYYGNAQALLTALSGSASPEELAPDQITLLINQGESYEMLNKFDKAAESYAKAEVLLQSHSQPYSKARLLNNQVSLTLAKNNTIENSEELQQKLTQATVIFSEENPLHPEISGTLNNQANLLQRELDYKGAIDNYLLAINIYNKINKEHPQLAGIYANLASAYQDNNQKTQAVSAVKNAIDILNTQAYRDQPDLAEVFNVAGDIYQKQGEFKKARTYYQKAIQLLSGQNQLPTTSLAMSYYNLSTLDTWQKNYPSANQSFIKAMTILAATEEPDSGVFQNVVQNYERFKELVKNELNLE